MEFREVKETSLWAALVHVLDDLWLLTHPIAAACTATARLGNIPFAGRRENYTFLFKVMVYFTLSLRNFDGVFIYLILLSWITMFSVFKNYADFSWFFYMFFPFPKNKF